MTFFNRLRSDRAPLLILFTAAFAVMFAAASPAFAKKTKQEKAESLVRAAAETVNYFVEDSAYEPLWELADTAKAMIVVPRSFRGGFIFGGSGGNALMMARNDDGTWSEPVFLTIGSVSFGLQIGGEMSESVLLVMSQRGMEHLLSTTVKLGADLSLAAGPIGGGAKAQTVDVLAFSRSRGLYGGMSIEGAVLKARHNWNKAYYGLDVSPADVVYREKGDNPTSVQVQSAVWTLAHRDVPVTFAPLQAGEGAPENLTLDDEAPVIFEDDAVYGAPLETPVTDPYAPN